MRNTKPTVKIDAFDSREVFAAAAFLLGKTPHNSLILLPQGSGASTNLPIARFPLPNLLKENQMPEVIDKTELIDSSMYFLKELLKNGATNCLVILAGPAVRVQLPGMNSETFYAQSKALEELAVEIKKQAESLAKDVGDYTYFDPFVAVHIFHGGKAKVLDELVPEGGSGYSNFGDIFESNFAANLVGSGVSLELIEHADLLLNQTAKESLQNILNSGLSFLTKSELQQGVDPVIAFKQYVEAGGAQAAWLHVATPTQMVKKYEHLEKLVTAVLAAHGRDQIFLQIFNLLGQEVSNVEQALSMLFESPNFKPNKSIDPGGQVFWLLNQWAELWRFAVEKQVSETFQLGLGKLAALSAVFTWWAGRFAEAAELSKQLVLVDPNNHMAQLVQELLNSRYRPKWFQEISNLNL